MVKNIYVYENQEFHSIRELAEYAGLNEKTLTARLRRGLSVEEACNKDSLKNRYFEDGKRGKKSLAQICREQEKDAALVRNRLRYGYSLDDALNRQKKISRQGRPIVVYGIQYDSVSSALRNLGLTDRESAVRRRLKSGMNPDDAFDL